MRELAEAGSFIWNLCRKYGGEKEMSVTVLKRIALGAMVVNYIGVFIPGAPVWLQWLGRLSAPLFFYCMAWSIDRTGNKKAYFLRLYLAGVAMGLLNLIMSFVAQGAGLGAAVSSNIFATLFASAFFIEVIEYGRKHPKRRMRLFLSYGLFQVAVAGLWAALYELVGVPYAVLNFFSALLGNALTCEGALLYVLMGVLFYYTKEDKKKLAVGYAALSLVFFVNSAFGVWGRLFMLLGKDVLVMLMEIMTGLVLWGASFRPVFDVYHMFHSDFQWLMIAALPLLLCCNEGRRRRRNRPSVFQKYFYYVFYPAHLYLLWFLGTVVLK